MRPDTITYFLKMAVLVSTRSTCVRRSVGCVLTNHRNHVIATGYNGVAAKLPHCVNCKRNSRSGEDLDKCMATHAETNALLQCPDVYSIKTVYVTVSPCIHCLKLLMNTSAEEIIFLHEYPGSDFCRELWESANRKWTYVNQ